MKITKRVMSILFSLLMLFSCVPLAAGAEDNSEPTDWVEIYTFEDLYDIRYDLTANYKLMNDIDMTEQVKFGGDYDYMGQGWDPIGSKYVYADDAFCGIFDGNGHTISGMRINVTKFPSGTERAVFFGLFACVNGLVKNLSVAGTIKVDGSYKNNYAGGIAACLNSTGVIENCANYVNLSITGLSGSYGSQVCCFGGIVGLGHGGNVYRCVNGGKIESVNAGGSRYDYVSGIISYQVGEIKDCYNIGEIHSNSQFNAGIMYSSYSWPIINCYNAGVVSGGDYNYAISNSSSTGCFYLKDSGATSTGAAERTDAQMKRQISFEGAGWDLTNVWTMEGREDYFYPELRDVPLLSPDDFKTQISGTLKIDGSQEAGSVLTASIDNLAPEDATVSYSWTIDDTEVSATDSYQINAEDIGETLTLTVTGIGDFKGTLTASCVLGAPHEHTEEIIPAVPATCTESGLTQGLKCSECGEILTAQEVVPANGHTPVTAGASPASCNRAGFTGVTYCSVCKEVLDAGEPVPALEHHFNSVITPPTCTTKGYTTYTCERGDSEYIADYVNALGHTAPDKSGNCTRCHMHIQDITQSEQPTSQEQPQQPKGACKYCGKVHDGAFGWLISFFHSILAIFKR